MRAFDESSSIHPSRAAAVTTTPLRRGALVDVREWALAHVESRLRMRAHAVDRLARGAFLFSHTTAGAFHSLPLLGVGDRHVHTIPFSANPPKTHRDVVRHKLPTRADDATIIDGLLVTSLDRTVYDLIRMLPLDGALAVMDAALNRVGWNGETHGVDHDRAEGLRALVRARIGAAPGARGICTARVVVDLGDARVQSAGESRTLARVWELQMPRPDLQVEVETRLGPRWKDFDWPELSMFGEFDGAVKLTDKKMARGRPPAEIRAAQAERRAAIEDADGSKGMSWGWSDTDSADAFWRAVTRQGWKPRWRA